MATPTGVFNGNSRHNAMTLDDRIDAQQPRPYDRKLSIIRATMGDDAYSGWYLDVVNLPGPAWRNAIDEKMLQLCDADGRAVVSMTTKQAKDSARRCGCITCTGALENVCNSIMWYARPGYCLKSVAAHAKKQARANRRYFIQQLREALASAVIKHSGDRQP